MLLVPNSLDGTRFIVSKNEHDKLEKSISKDTKIAIETLSTQLVNKDFVLLQFEKYSESQVNFLAEQYDNISIEKILKDYIYINLNFKQ